MYLSIYVEAVSEDDYIHKMESCGVYIPIYKNE